MCVYCKQGESIPLYPTYDIFGNKYHISRCLNCKAFVLTQQPDDLLLSKAYDTSYYGENTSKFTPFIEYFINYFRYSRARKLKKYLSPGSKVLDIGCGNGGFLSSLSKFGNFNIYGIELPGNSANRASKIEGINLKIGSLEANDFPKDNFDAITLFHVFEHLTTPRETLQIISEIIKKGGILIMSFPNIASFQSRLFKGAWLHLDPPRHLFFFAPKDFLSLMKDFGFELIKTKYFSTEQNPFGMVQSILNLFPKKREILYERLKGNKQYTFEYSAFNIFLQKAFFILSFPIFAVTDLIGSFFKASATVEFTFRKK
jgi:2-polyprenyl-3-methyl-5-hydroxy-6-metoxy-1,4-benzoquinol methylase